MALRHFALPDLGEGLTEADILGWLVAEGDEVRLNQPMVEVETAKAAVEVPSPWAGVVRELHVPPGQTVPVGTTIISIDTVTDEQPGAAAGVGRDAEGASPDAGEGAGPGAGAQEATLVGYGPRPAQARRRRQVATARAAPKAAQAGPAAARTAPPAAASATPPDAASAQADVTVLAKPPVRKLARDLGVDLRTVRGSGPAGSITRADVGAAGPAAAHPAAAHPAGSRQRGVHPAQRPGAGGDERVAWHGMRKAMAEAMTQSAFTAPHASVFLRVDATGTTALRSALAGHPEFAETEITPLAVTARAVCVAAGRAPLINASVDEAAQEIVLHGAVNLGIAVATDRGLLVPNIKDAGGMSLLELADAIKTLSVTAREGHTRRPDLTSGTLTITNVGVFGVDGGTAILNPGESAILCLGTVRPRPWVHEGQLAVRDVVELSLSFDHRIVDGQVAAKFLADVGAMLTDPRLLLALA